MTSLAGRSQGLAVDRSNRLAARISEHPRDMQAVALTMLDGTSIRGMLHRAPGTRTLDFLNRDDERFVAITAVTLVHSGTTEEASFVAINKAQIVQVVEVADAE